VFIDVRVIKSSSKIKSLNKISAKYLSIGLAAVVVILLMSCSDNETNNQICAQTLWSTRE
jgi:hypothetical protein